MKIKKIKRKIRKVVYLKRFDGITIKKIDEVGINTNLSCNLNCVMCHQKEIKCHKDMSYELFEKILINLKRAKVTKISIVGGEIFVLKDPWKFIYLMEKMKFNYDLSSNLFHIPHIERFAKLKGLEMITTSIDGLKETHNKIRGNPRAFQNTVNNIKLILKMKIPIDSACVVQRANIDELEDIMIYLGKIGIKNFTFMVANKINPQEKKSAIGTIEKITGARADFYVNSKPNSLGDLSEKDIKLFKRKVLNLKKIAKKFKARVSFSTQLINPEVMDKKTNLRDYTCSLFAGYSPYVHADGSLNTCVFTKIKGDKFDLSRHDPLGILNSEEYIKIRKSFKKFGATPKCRYCCALCKK